MRPRALCSPAKTQVAADRRRPRNVPCYSPELEPLDPSPGAYARSGMAGREELTDRGGVPAVSFFRIPVGARREPKMVAPTETVWKIEPHTKAKHQIVRKYLAGWIPAL